jgi:hypothetical protein
MATLLTIGVVYVLLGVWCTLRPSVTSEAVGFRLVGDGGKSEFVTVYGGLEVGLGLAMIVTAVVPELRPGGLVFALVLSAALPCFRIPTLLTLSVPRTTWILAGVEVVFVALLLLAWLRR